MSTAIALQMAMPKQEAEALLSSLQAELRRGFNEYWYSDRYRDVPVGLRSRRILDDYPAMAGNKRTIGALKAALSASN